MELKTILDEDTYDISPVVDFAKTFKIVDMAKNVFEILSENVGTILKVTYDNFDEKIHHLDPRFFDSTSNTLKSILICSRIGNIIDAHVLVRKLRDDLFQWLYLLSTIEFENQIRLKELNDNRIENINSKSDRNNNYSILIWFNNTLHQKKYFNIRKDKYEYKKCVKSLGDNNNEVAILFKEYLSSSFNNLKDLDNFVHGNGEEYVFGNKYDHRNRNIYEDLLVSLQSKIEDILLCYMSTLMLLSPELLISEDYFSCIESGVKPSDKMQTSIAPIFQDYFDAYVKPSQSDLIMYLNLKNRYNMVIE